MAYVNFPCQNCPDRYPGCHDHCEKYKAAKEKHNAAAKVKWEYDVARADSIRRSTMFQKGKNVCEKHRKWKRASNR